ncbi:hypothetical protein, partial [Treponema zioleckii]|uniref:hypothetical protein n=1 Tax=Treponema zioleckii TaxID=331680 RepID=UPI001A9195B6
FLSRVIFFRSRIAELKFASANSWRLASEFVMKKEALYVKIRESDAFNRRYRFGYTGAYFPIQIIRKEHKKNPPQT